MTATRRARTPKAATPKVAAPASELKRLQRQAAREQLETEFLAQVRAVRLPAPRTQLLWHATHKYRFDFAWVEARLAVEVDGGTWLAAKGGHTSHAGYHHDRVRDAEAALAGWLVLRLDAELVRSGEGLSYVERILKRRRAAA